MKKLKIVAALSLVGLALSGCASSDDSTTSDGLQTVNVGHVQLAIFSPLYVADAKGYFEDEGIKIKLEAIKSGQDAIPLAASGKLDVVVAGFSAGLFSAVETGLDVKVVGSMGVSAGEAEEPPSALIASKKLVDDGTITTVADLKGRKVAVAGGAGGTGAFYVGLALEEVGLSITDVDLVALGNPDMPTAVANGSVDAAFASAPFSNMPVEDGTAVNLWTTPEGTSGTGVIYGGDFASSDLAQKFFTALTRGAQDLQGDDRYTDENLSIIGAATGQTAEQVKAVPLYSWLPDLAPLPEQLASMERMWMELGSIIYSNPISEADYVDASFSQNS
ncbi:ABC transporter substrate-binding protein [Cryobacterium sp. PH31-O1]|uniref:ABC transporter substrate-binding protein n=1 Tax=Cryobacterium sp. PH31-O1 TaxID=3046306 RepID=UPI0024BBD238|nr:ABC transporter substrate-binding protein [Cryobacterium sp. PH31-O1]MDJ0339053.1 ABC transporter substrate-binding protein [Cryobacterium sp. PH31-O1]